MDYKESFNFSNNIKNILLLAKFRYILKIKDQRPITKIKKN